jgi:hypothetical protein
MYIPNHPNLTREEIDHMCNCVLSAIEEAQWKRIKK